MREAVPLAIVITCTGQHKPNSSCQRSGSCHRAGRSVARLCLCVLLGHTAQQYGHIARWRRKRKRSDTNHEQRASNPKVLLTVHRHAWHKPAKRAHGVDLAATPAAQSIAYFRGLLNMVPKVFVRKTPSKQATKHGRNTKAVFVLPCRGTVSPCHMLYCAVPSSFHTAGALSP